MSEYIRILRRLHEHQAPAQPVVAGTVTPAGQTAAAEEQVEATELAPAAPVSGDLASYKQLYDSIRLATGNAPVRRIVLAPVSGRERADAVIAGLAAHIAQLGSRVLVAELTLVRGRPILRRQRDASLASLDVLGLHFDGDLMPLDLSSTASQDEVVHWLGAAQRTADVVLVHGSPLCDSVDAALLARVCDGIVLVAEARVTERASLHQAAQRLRSAGCRALGVVLTGTQDRLPRWLQRLVDRPRHSFAPQDSEEYSS